MNVVTTPREKRATSKEKEADIRLSVYVACHTALRTIDHLTDMINELGENSIFGSMRLHRTKCVCLIKNVISPALKLELKKAVSGKKFVLMVDESTDVSAQKLLCVTISFRHDKEGIQSAYLGLIPVIETNADSLFSALEMALMNYDMHLENCIGFASDGASVMVGVNNSVWTRVKVKSPDCVQMKCICHSLALCIQHAFEKLPSNIGFLLKEIPTWFSKSGLRRERFTHVFDAINADNDLESGKSHPSPFMKTSQTRWLVRGKVMYNILVNWDELVGYFTIAEVESKVDSRFKARMIKEMMQDVSNRLIFQFATPIVQEFERVNAMFQSEKADPHSLMNELDMLQKSLRGRLYNVAGSKKPIEECDFGYKFIHEMQIYVDSILDEDKRGLELQKMINLKMRCHNMLDEAMQQVEKRLPPSMDIFKGLSSLSPNIVLSQVDRAKFEELPSKHLMGQHCEAIEEQYRRLIFVMWNDEPAFKTTGLPTDTVTFWEGVCLTPGFKELAQYALTCLITPFSNAGIERVFSVVNATKTKQRNKLGLDSLDAIIRIKAHLFFNGKCCKQFKVTQEMLELFTSRIYETASIEDNAELMDSWFAMKSL